MELTFDEAIELLEITNISKIQPADIPRLRRKLKTRWHPDTVEHLNDPTISEEYTLKSQQVDIACDLILSYLNGTYQTGEAFTSTQARSQSQPEEIIRKEAARMQEAIKHLWNVIRERKYKWSQEEVTISDGYRLKDLLDRDYKEGIAVLSIISFFYGLVFMAITAVIGNAINSQLGSVLAVVCLLQSFACVLGFAPLSRFWLPQLVSDIMIRFINFGLAIYHWADNRGQNANVFLKLLINAPVLFATLVKYLILLPLTELAKAVVGNKVVGVVKKKVDYYAGAADWYINQLIQADPDDMSADELFHLSHLYSELSDVLAATTVSAKDKSENSFRSGDSDGKESEPFPKRDKTSEEKKPATAQSYSVLESELSVERESVATLEDDIIEPSVLREENEDSERGEAEENLTSPLFPMKELFEAATKEESCISEPQQEGRGPSGLNQGRKSRKTGIWFFIIFLLISTALGILIFKNKGVPSKNIPAALQPTDTSTAVAMQPLDIDTTIILQTSQVLTDNVSAGLNENKQPIVVPNDDDSAIKLKSLTRNPSSRSFVVLDKGKVKKDLLNKPLCQGITFTGEGQSLFFRTPFPTTAYQKSLGLYATLRIVIQVTDEINQTSCTTEVIYRKDQDEFELENYADK